MKKINRPKKKTVSYYTWSYQPQDDHEQENGPYSTKIDTIKEAKYMYDRPLGKCYVYRLYTFYTDETYEINYLNFNQEEENYYNQFVEGK